MSFKLVHQFYPAKNYIKKKTLMWICGFSCGYQETGKHVFWYCPIVKDFWQKLHAFIVENTDEFLLWKNALFGPLESNTQNNTHPNHNPTWLMLFL